MHSALVITLVNTVFWFALHFGVAELITHLPAETQHRLFDWNRPFFRVSEREMALYQQPKVLPPPAAPLEGSPAPVQSGI